MIRAALLPGLLAAAVSAPTGAHASPAPTCAPEGVRVVVDFGRLAAADEEALRVRCDDSVAGERAAASIADAGFELQHATRDPGFVCRVQGVPADDPCVRAAPADAYWSIWWAAEGGEWVYSSRGVGSLRTPEGGALALVWHQGDGEATPPAVAPGAASPGAASRSAEAPSGDARESGGEAAEPGALPAWVPAGVLAALLAAGALVAVRRRGR